MYRWLSGFNRKLTYFAFWAVKYCIYTTASPLWTTARNNSPYRTVSKTLNTLYSLAYSHPLYIILLNIARASKRIHARILSLPFFLGFNILIHLRYVFLQYFYTRWVSLCRHKYIGLTSTSTVVSSLPLQRLSSSIHYTITIVLSFCVRRTPTCASPLDGKVAATSTFSELETVRTWGSSSCLDCLKNICFYFL